MDSWSKHWHVVVYLIGLVFLGGMTFADNQAQEEKIEGNKKQIEKENERLKDIDDRVIRVEEEQKHQGEDIGEIKDDVKEILKELRER